MGHVPINNDLPFFWGREDRRTKIPQGLDSAKMNLSAKPGNPYETLPLKNIPCMYSWFIGILTAAYFNPFYCWVVKFPIFTANNQGFGCCSYCFCWQISWSENPGPCEMTSSMSTMISMMNIPRDGRWSEGSKQRKQNKSSSVSPSQLRLLSNSLQLREKSPILKSTWTKHVKSWVLGIATR